MHRRSPYFALVFLLILSVIEWSAYYSGCLLFESLGHPHLVKYFGIVYWTETLVILLVLIFLQKSLKTMFSVKRTYYGFQAAGILMTDILPKLAFTIVALLAMIVQGIYIGLNNLFIHSSHDRLNISYMLIVGFLIAAFLFLAIVRGILVGRFDFRVVRETIHFDSLPTEFDKLKIVQISDMHIGSFYKHKGQIVKAVELINNLNPDIIFFTGDMVNHIAEEARGLEDVFQKLKAPLGKFSILGNHDYGDYVKWESEEAKRKNLDELIKFERDAGFDILLNENRIIGKNGQQIAIVGVENWGNPPFAQYGFLPDAVKGTENIPFRILLSHDPSHWDEQVLHKTNLQLTLSGHTHGMQFGIKIGEWQWSPVQWRYERWQGHYQKGEQSLYVNRGLGHIGFPGRVGMLPEITLIELRK